MNPEHPSADPLPPPALPPTTLAPFLAVRGGARAVEFYVRAFGARELLRVEDSHSVVAHLAIAGAEFWVADESPPHGNVAPDAGRGASVRLILTVPDPDAVFASAVAAGATVVWEVADQPYGWRVGRLCDPFGHHWEIGKPLGA